MHTQPKHWCSSIGLPSRDILCRVGRVVDLESLAPHRCGFESHQELSILSCEEAIQLAFGTSVVLLRCPFVPKIMHAWNGTWGLPPPVKLESRHITLTVLVKRKTKPASSSYWIIRKVNLFKDDTYCYWCIWTFFSIFRMILDINAHVVLLYGVKPAQTFCSQWLKMASEFKILQKTFTYSVKNKVLSDKYF